MLIYRVTVIRPPPEYSNNWVCQYTTEHIPILRDAMRFECYSQKQSQNDNPI